jgi:N-acetylglucosaminyl-diphospho-decaprenol L-rhamnosyltransferase
MERKNMKTGTGTKRGILVVVVNYGTSDLTIDCLRSLWTDVSALPNCRVAVVDNASPDNSLDRIVAAIQANEWNSRMSVIPLCRNRGFAAGNNAAIRSWLSRDPAVNYIMLLNPDTVVRSGALQELVDYMEANAGVGITGSRLEHPDGTVQCSAFREPTLLGELENGARLGFLSRVLRNYVVCLPASQEPIECDWVSGAAMLVRRKVFEATGLLDEGFFLYYEEVDFCLRARRAGWQVWHVPDSRVIHREGTSTGIGNHQQRRPAWWFDSRRRYFLKNRGMGYTAGVDLARILGLMLWRLRRGLQRRPDPDPPHFLRDLIRHSIFMKGPHLYDGGFSSSDLDCHRA